MEGSSAAALNQSGQVVGSFSTGGEFGENQPFLWTGGPHTLLPMGSFESGDPSDINDQGEIVGHGTNIPIKVRIFEMLRQRGWGRWVPRSIEEWAIKEERAVLWKDGELYDLTKQLVDGKGWILLVAKDINNKGQIVGEGTFQGKYRAFLLDPVGN
ncbi:MAG: hypothetical protein HUU16_22085, partial [Candidatus Omnitrophica bacterium]|nr:hypothetical protein [Candidatus Omnitrophota bacterium]